MLPPVDTDGNGIGPIEQDGCYPYGICKQSSLVLSRIDRKSKAGRLSGYGLLEGEYPKYRL